MAPSGKALLQVAVMVMLARGGILSGEAIAAAASAPAPAEQLEELDEVHVRGTKLWQMRREIESYEDRFYARYNELNKNRDFDVNCGREARLGTRITQRVCRVQYYEDAQAEYAAAMVTGTPLPISPEIIELERREDFRKHMLAIASDDPELGRLLRERYKMQERYEKERKKRMKGRWVLFE